MKGPYLEPSSWGSSSSSTCPCLGLKLLNHFKNLALESRGIVPFKVPVMSGLKPLPIAALLLPAAPAVLPFSAVPLLPIASAELPFGAALGLSMAKALVGRAAPIDAAFKVAPGLKADMVCPMALALVWAIVSLPSAHHDVMPDILTTRSA